MINIIIAITKFNSKNIDKGFSFFDVSLWLVPRPQRESHAIITNKTVLKGLRGLKRGDPVPPILYNLAFEPFLLLMIYRQTYQGYLFDILQTKVLCYSNDAFVFVHDYLDLSRLISTMELFYSASNAKFNNNKVEVFLISGRDTWDNWRFPLTRLQVRHLHSVDDTFVIHPGSSLIQSRIQRINFMAGLVAKLKSSVELHATRSLSVWVEQQFSIL